MKEICKFIRKAKEGGFEIVTWLKDKNGVKTCKITPTTVTPEQQRLIEAQQYCELSLRPYHA